MGSTLPRRAQQALLSRRHLDLARSQPGVVVRYRVARNRALLPCSRCACSRSSTGRGSAWARRDWDQSFRTSVVACGGT